MCSINSIFDKIICINLLERSDKRNIIMNKFKLHNIEVEFYDAVIYGFSNKQKYGNININQPNELGCAISHYNVIKQAYLKNYDKIMIFEDDVMFCEDFTNKFLEYYNNLPNDWDCFMLYSYMKNNESIFNPNFINRYWFRGNNSWSTMAYALTRKGMEEYINIMDECISQSDLPLHKMCLNKNVYVSYPTLCVPDISKGSDIRSYMNYENGTDINKFNLLKYN